VAEQSTDHIQGALAGAAAHAPAGAEHGSGGLPQFDPTYWPGQIVWLLVIFVVLYFIVSKVLLPKVGGAIASREGKIAGDIAEARRLKDEAEVQAAAAAAGVAQARGRAQKLAADAKAKAQAEAAASEKAEDQRLGADLDKAEAAINAAREAALGNVRAIAAETAQAIVEKLTGKPAEAGEIEAAMSASAA
jgi:F-type H+-transporting ATPase subunit b